MPDSIRKVLLSIGPGGVPFWGINLGLDGNYAAKTGGVTRGFLAAGARDDGWKTGGRHVEKVGDVEGATGDKYKASSVIHREEAGNGSRVSSPAINI